MNNTNISTVFLSFVFLESSSQIVTKQSCDSLSYPTVVANKKHTSIKGVFQKYFKIQVDISDLACHD
jgi:hypothetical protein